MELIGDHDRWTPEQRVERIGDLYLAPQTPGIMRSRRTAVASIGQSSLRSSKTCKLDDVDSQAYLADVFASLVAGHPINRLEQLLPWSWAAAQQTRRAALTPLTH